MLVRNRAPHRMKSWLRPWCHFYLHLCYSGDNKRRDEAATGREGPAVGVVAGTRADSIAGVRQVPRHHPAAHRSRHQRLRRASQSSGAVSNTIL